MLTTDLGKPCNLDEYQQGRDTARGSHGKPTNLEDWYRIVSLNGEHMFDQQCGYGHESYH